MNRRMTNWMMPALLIAAFAVWACGGSGGSGTNPCADEDPWNPSEACWEYWDLRDDRFPCEAQINTANACLDAHCPDQADACILQHCFEEFMAYRICGDRYYYDDDVYDS